MSAARYERPLTAVGKGLLAGAVGTGAMTGYQLAVAKLRGGGSSSTPGEVARRVLGGVVQRDVPEQPSSAMTNVTHALYGTGWGAVYGVFAGSRRRRGALGPGIRFGLFVWSVSLVQLPAMKLAPPVWEQPPAEVAVDASYHVVYGVAVAATFAALRG